MECILCESMHSRMLNCREWFCKGGALFDIDDLGRLVRKEYGRSSHWVVVKRSKHSAEEDGPAIEQASNSASDLISNGDGMAIEKLSAASDEGTLPQRLQIRYLGLVHTVNRSVLTL